MKDYKTPKNIRDAARDRAEKKRRAAGVPVRETKTLAEKLEENSIAIPWCGCLVWLGSVTHSGHGEVSCNGSKKRTHRAAWEVAKGQIPSGLNVLHQCDVPSCINPNHLFLGTQTDNMRDMYQKDRGVRGSRHGNSKISEAEADEIRKWPGKLKDISEKFGIAISTACQIRNGKQRRVERLAELWVEAA